MIEYLPRMYNVLDLSPIPQKGRRRRGGGRGGGGRGGGEEEGGGGGEEIKDKNLELNYPKQG
jgi:hypothetical protein